MKNCVILDDYQGVALKSADWNALTDRVAITSLREHVTDEDALVDRLANADIVVIMRERTPFPASLFKRLPRLRLLVTSGMRNAAVDLAAAGDVVVCGTGSSSAPPAELTWGLILGLARQIPFENAQMRQNGPWQSTVGVDLHGRHLGIIGLGKIGIQVARVGQAFGMHVSAWSPNLTDERAAAAGVQRVASKEELLERSDFVTIHLVLAPTTRGIIGAVELHRMRPSAFLINTSRAGLVDQAALIQALEENRFAGAALDVFDAEPLPAEHPFRRLPNVLATPHLGYVSEDNYRTYFTEAVDDIEAWLTGSPVRQLNQRSLGASSTLRTEKEAILDPALTIDSHGCVSVAVFQKDRSLLLRPLDSRATGLQWGVLLGLSALFGVTLELLHLPAALLLGPMVAAIVLAMANGAVRIPLSLFFLAQGVLGCLIARSVPLSIFAEIGRNWPIFLLGVASVVAAAATLGGLLTRWRVLPGTTAVWGSSPGAASAMTLMAEAYGADIRLVAFMQYTRVLCVAVVASIVSRFWVAGSGAPVPEIIWFPAVGWVSFAETVALAGAGAVLGHRLRLPAGPLLVPLSLGVLLQDTGVVSIELPPWLLAMSYALIGWSIGLRFTRSILVHAARALPRVIASILTLIAVCGLFAAGLVLMVGVDPLTAYLAMSPGGLDSVAIIAASSTVDLPFVMAMQTARFLVVLLTGPSMARFIARRVGASWKNDAPLQ